MSTTTQYIGERYVPIVADPVEWNANREYEHLTIVMYNGDSYISKQDVPKGAQITNTRYWLKTNNYNAQVNQAIEKSNEAISKSTDAIGLATSGLAKANEAEGKAEEASGKANEAIAKADNALGKFPVSIANGGTGSTNASAARTALDAAQSGGATGTLRAAEQAIDTLNQAVDKIDIDGLLTVETNCYLYTWTDDTARLHLGARKTTQGYYDSIDIHFADHWLFITHQKSDGTYEEVKLGPAS